MYDAVTSSYPPPHLQLGVYCNSLLANSSADDVADKVDWRCGLAGRRWFVPSSYQ